MTSVIPPASVSAEGGAEGGVEGEGAEGGAEGGVEGEGAEGGAEGGVDGEGAEEEGLLVRLEVAGVELVVQVVVEEEGLDLVVWV